LVARTKDPLQFAVARLGPFLLQAGWAQLEAFLALEFAWLGRCFSMFLVERFLHIPFEQLLRYFNILDLLFS